MKKKLMIEMDYDEFENIVTNQYKVNDYSFVATEECGNDSDHTFSVSGIEPLDKYETEKLLEFIEKNGGTCYVNHTLFQDLVNKGVLEPGEYIVKVCW